MATAAAANPHPNPSANPDSTLISSPSTSPSTSTTTSTLTTSTADEHLNSLPQQSDTVLDTLSPARSYEPSHSPSRTSLLAASLVPSPNTVKSIRTTYKHRQAALSTSSTKSTRPSIFNFAALARDKTSNAIATLSEPSLKRNRPSSTGLYLSAQRSPTSPLQKQNSHSPTTDSRETVNATEPNISPPTTTSLAREPTASSASSPARSLLETNPPSQAYTDTATDTPIPVTFVPVTSQNKMHQTSSRLLRMTSDDRPYTRDFKDLFATLVVSLPLASHRVRLTRVEHSFLSEEAINNLGSLKFSQSNRMPDPKDPSRIVTTTTTTTFSMAREMARSVCQRFLDARFIESADGKQAKEFTMKGSVWQMTPKGIHVLERFCAKNGIQQKHVTELVNSPRNTMQLVILERDSATDKLSSDRSTIEVIFRRFVGTNGPNVKNSTSSADSDSLSEYKDGIAGVRMASERKVGSPPKVVYQSFTGKAASDWLMDCCMAVDRRETTEIATLFLDQDLIWCVQSDRLYLSQMGLDKDKEVRFQPTKHAIYQLSQKGKDVLNMVTRERTSESEGTSSSTRPGVSRDSNTQKLDKILKDAALRLLFRENLRDTHCEENLSFYLDVDEFLKSCRTAIKATSPTRAGNKGSSQSLDSVKETMASAYGIYNAFLAPGSPCELNIDHLLRNQLATRMTKAVGQDAAMIDSLKEVTKLFEEAQISVFKLMASDSVPKFMKSSKYEQTLKNYDFDSLTSRFNNSMSLPERSMSRSNR
ncbi:regulator of G protein signaling domain-containing protein [Amylocarpus encephaloides]|uniref:Regulator of G protein signaling domain-containing protein n=1 Tax=Amylocarpus encephaloides TaxID=45428 RepID=A0A9P7YL01_9HELO|nr:regulator of G protein signaling domain-containing protein [Amylocarpus encephaloides]